MPNVRFHSNHFSNLSTDKYFPYPAKSIVPEWFSGANRYFREVEGLDKKFVHERGLTFKGCPALLDIFLNGYILVTPCDIHVYDENGTKKIFVENQFHSFCRKREEAEGFPSPAGHSEENFVWYPNWAVELPQGYSAIHMSPINRFDLPFTTVAGIIDNDTLHTTVQITFFIAKDFTGVIPAGTPYVQIIPFKREVWTHDTINHTPQEIYDREENVRKTFSVPEGGVYKKRFWSRKDYS